MTTLYDNSAIDDEPMQMLLIDGRPAFRRLGPDVAYEAKYEVAETIDRPMPRPCVPLPVCLEPPVFAEVLAAPLTGEALLIETSGFSNPANGFSETATAWSAPGGFGDVWTYGDVIHDGDVFAGDTFTARHASFASFTARPVGWQYDHPAPVPLPAAGVLLIAALVGLRLVWRK